MSAKLKRGARQSGLSWGRAFTGLSMLLVRSEQEITEGPTGCGYRSSESNCGLSRFSRSQ